MWMCGMERLACADIPALPLQVLLRLHPEWRPHPVAVVAEDAPHSAVLWVNARAREGGVFPGLRYGSALSLIPDLRAAPVPASDIARAVDALTGALRRFSPDVEPADADPGVFWLDASGLAPLHASLSEWAADLRRDLSKAGYEAAIAVGFTRFGTYAAARASTSGTRVFESPGEERAAVQDALLRDVSLPPETLEALGRLGVRTVGDLLRLPAAGLLERFGPAVERLHRQATGDLWRPLRPHRAVEQVRRQLVLDAPEADAQRLLFIVKYLLHPLLTRLASRGEAVITLEVRFRLGREWTVHTVRPASPTLDAVRLSDLVRLRLEAVRLEGGVTEIDVEAAGAPAAPEQLVLLAEQPPRDPEAGTRALDRLRARYGDDAVVCAVLRDGHLPEARYGWVPMVHVPPPQPRPSSARSLVRRVFDRPVPFRAGLPCLAQSSTAQIPPVPGHAVAAGPFVVSGGWWAAPPPAHGESGGDDEGRETYRTYYFMEGANGALWWVFYDRLRGRWYLHGRVE
jgi:protein ImuB